MLQHPAGNAPLSIHWAFVVHFRTDADVALGQVSGKVEHILSGQGTHFASVDEFLTFVARIFASTSNSPSSQEKQ